jgi:hypothetical protein
MCNDYFLPFAGLHFTFVLSMNKNNGAISYVI